MRLSRYAVIFAVVAGSTLGAGSILAADGVIAKRQADMKAMGKEMGGIKDTLAAKGDLAKVQAHAETIRKIMADVPALFPAGSDTGPTDALPAIWTDQAGFDTAAKRADGLADALATAAGTGETAAATAAFAALGKNGCGGCHQTYRKPQG